MPELPEVESIRLSLNTTLPKKAKLIHIDFFRNDLRFFIPKKQLNKLIGKNLIAIKRRAKYLLFTFSEGIMISHLGMTGNWRVIKSANKDKDNSKKHDHICFSFVDNIQLIYNDPRRFGYLDYIENPKDISKHPYFAHLGLEPFDSEFTAAYLKQKAVGSARSIKVFLMDQSIVVGIGNIYASEILFKAGIRPQRKLSKIKNSEWEALIKSSQKILQTAIELGGSTIRDYRNADGSSGSFQEQHLVYNRKGQTCRSCGSKILSATIGGRSTYWCPNCQT